MSAVPNSRAGGVPSHVVGARDPALLETTIGQALKTAAARWPAAEALVSAEEGVRLTFTELDARVSALAAGFVALGLERGARIGIWSPNNAAWALVQFAAARAGLVLVTINPAYRLSELEYALRQLGVTALVAAERFKSSDYLAMTETLVPELVGAPTGALVSKSLPALRFAIKIGGAARPGWLEIGDVSDAATPDAETELAARQSALSCDDAVNVQFTSGTTGLPKGATLSHRNILNNGYLVGCAVGLEAGDRLCIPVPLYHCFGMVMGNLACVTHGATMVYPAAGFDPAATLRVAETEACTHLYGVPTMFIAMLADPTFARRNLGSLRGGIMAGAPCPTNVMRAVIDKMHMREITIAYGMTETSPVSFQTARDDPIDKRIGTVGRVQPHLECKIVDAEGRIVPRGEPGELCTRGYSVMQGYWGEPDRTAETIDGEGWMHSGDLAVIDEDGYCGIVGRIKDMVIRGGENIYPREIEEFLHTHRDVADVAVVGVPDARYGEELCAWIRVRPGGTLGAEAVWNYCRGRIAHYKIPRYIRIVDDFPTTVTGKVQKFVIRDAMIAELGEQQAVDPAMG